MHVLHIIATKGHVEEILHPTPTPAQKNEHTFFFHNNT